jgi:hypothetical protein
MGDSVEINVSQPLREHGYNGSSLADSHMGLNFPYSKYLNLTKIY